MELTPKSQDLLKNVDWGNLTDELAADALRKLRGLCGRGALSSPYVLGDPADFANEVLTEFLSRELPWDSGKDLLDYFLKSQISANIYRKHKESRIITFISIVADPDGEDMGSSQGVPVSALAEKELNPAEAEKEGQREENENKLLLECMLKDRLLYEIAKIAFDENEDGGSPRRIVKTAHDGSRNSARPPRKPLSGRRRARLAGFLAFDMIKRIQPRKFAEKIGVSKDDIQNAKKRLWRWLAEHFQSDPDLREILAHWSRQRRKRKGKPDDNGEV